MLLNEDQLRRLAAEGKSVGQIAKEMNVSRSRVWRCACVMGIEVLRLAKRGPKPMTEIEPRARAEREQQAIALAAEGLHLAEIARRIGYTHRGAKLLLQRHGVTPKMGGRGGPSGLRDMPRAEKIASMYRQGVTLQKIGDTFGMTRERVRQILKKQGITGKDGGQNKCAQSKVAAAAAKRDARYLAKHGMTYAEYRQVLATGLQKAFRNQKNAAKNRGIDWSLTIAQWLDVWRTSGKLEQRGRGKGKYVMSRIKDTGGYELGNVHIQLAEQNSLEAVGKWLGKTKANRGVFCLYPGSTRPWLARIAGKQIGRYATEQEAADARMAYIETNGLRLRADGGVHSSALLSA